MHGFFLGAIGFCSLFIHDLCQIRHWKGFTRLFSIIGYTSVTAALIFLVRTTPLPGLGSLRFFIGTGCAALSTFLVIYSLFIELSYKAVFTAPEKRRVVSTGTYRLVRHPAFLWFTALILSLNLIYMSYTFFIFTMSLVLMDFIVVFIEDRLIFPILFSDYQDYKKEVPFLWPRLPSRAPSEKSRF